VDRVCASQVIPDLHSCVRELIENSLDAGASSISIRIRNCGSEVEVADNGTGISKENWISLFKPHHTSKLSDFESLYSGAIGTHGFRGEALASICTLATKVRVATRSADMDSGYVIEFDQSCEMTGEPGRVSKSVGTTITVYGLFEKSLPVRYHELLRTVKKELKLLSSQVYELAIINCTKSFELLIDGKCTISPISGCLTPYDVYKRLINGPGLMEFECCSDSGFTVTGWITPPIPTPWSLAASGSGSGGQYFYLNGRPINPIKKLVRGISRVYTKFEIKKISAIFCLTVPENKNYFDINVAVDKREILFCNGFEDLITDQVIAEIENLFNKCQNSKEAISATAPTPRRILITPSRKRVLEIDTVPLSNVSDPGENDKAPGPPSQKDEREIIDDPNVTSAVVESLSQVPEQSETIAEYQILPVTPQSLPPISYSFPKELFECMSVIGQFNNGFIIARLDAVPDRVPELFLIDQHAANEKYLFEEYFRNIKLNYQRLIIPIKVRSPPWIEQVVQDFGQELAENGFHAEVGEDSDGNRCIQINSLPTLSGIGFNRSAALTVKDFMEITEALHEGSIHPRRDTGDPLCLIKSLSSVRAHLASKACRTAIMVGDALSMSKMTNVVHSLSKLEQPWNCPHGRPTMKHLLSLDELSQFN